MSMMQRSTILDVGLEDSEHIAKILVDPKDGNAVHVCTTGPLWSDSDERGVYRTSDGGKSWKKFWRRDPRDAGCWP